ncbi:hypothetical protein PEC18_18605 [Paucibacter sp. O1-1]|nr:hypothetical protein [Paucibacter sp. O1-1]MDA3827809.1 hypothetical protein [Paucibacter sp. O1-1]
MKSTTLSDLLGHQGDAARVAAQVDRLVAGRPSAATDDDSMGDFWRDVKAARQEKRADNRAASAELLRKAGIQFETKNGGAHLIVSAVGKVIDFWPGTGRWIVRGCARPNYGVRRLIDGCTPEGDKS